jgi:phage gpG-like protein
MAITFKIIGDKELALYLGRISSKIKPQAIKGLNEIGDHLEKEIKNKFGTYQVSWPKLKRASVIAKYKRRSLGGGAKGTASVGGDDPLVLFGRLQNSIQNDVKAGNLEVEVFSDNVYAAVHEYGYKNIPPRSYMRLTLWQETDNVVDIMSKHIGRVI